MVISSMCERIALFIARICRGHNEGQSVEMRRLQITDYMNTFGCGVSRLSEEIVSFLTLNAWVQTRPFE
jgi:hypothetical protein